MKEHQILHRMVKTRGLGNFLFESYGHFEFEKVPPKPGHSTVWDAGVPSKGGVRGRKSQKNQKISKFSKSHEMMGNGWKSGQDVILSQFSVF